MVYAYWNSFFGWLPYKQFVFCSKWRLILTFNCFLWLCDCLLKTEKLAIKIQLLATLHWQKCLQKISCSIKCANKLFVCSFDTKLIANSVVNNEYCLNIVKLYVHSNACTSHQSSSYMSICKKVIAFQWLSSVWLIFDNNDSDLVLNISSIK